ncbi:MAG: hypothetical protein A3H54_03230 [Candidatus Yanofskybacteria bacterium RIFCSPLOWO2_02_FULL_41_13]|nr:MAG: hypothetical protein A3H54_03230 [Candidatus Yanofskybacteria bacterium RIFCSPLOWO2_02_FULL_41_13]
MSKSIKIYAGIVIGIAVALALSSAREDSLTFDEVPHIGAGYSYLVKHDMHLNPEHPPLVKDIAAIPLLFLNLKQDAFDSSFWQEDLNGQWDFGWLFLFHSGNNPDQIKNYARLPLISFFILSAILLFHWAYRLYGSKGAMIALVLFAFSPTVMAHSRFVTTDMAAVFGVLYATYRYVEYLKNPSRLNFWLAGIVFGLALLTKFSTIILVPFFLLLAIIKPGNLRRTFAIFAVGMIMVVWPVYYINIFNSTSAEQKIYTSEYLGQFYKQDNPLLRMVIWGSDKQLLRPLSQYVLGVMRVAYQTGESKESYFLGEVRPHGSYGYFPTVYFLKEPLAWWGLVLIVLIYQIWKLRRPSDKSSNRIRGFIKYHFEEFAMLLWLLIYWGISINSSLNIGVRHILPTYPFAIILVSGQISRMIDFLRVKSKKIMLAGLFSVVALLGWYVFENIHVYPYYLTYFNQVAGGPSGGYRYVADSNLDWGQDLIRFSNLVIDKNISKIELGYFGWADPSYYLGDRYLRLNWNKYKDANDFLARNQSDGWIAVSATHLQNSAGAKKTIHSSDTHGFTTINQ